MKGFYYFAILSLTVCIVYATIETCSDVTECSEGLKSKCIAMSKALDETQKLVVACKNGICMCNIEFAERPPAQIISQNEDLLEKSEKAEMVTDKLEDS